MKLGAENRNKTMLAVVLLLLGLVMFVAVKPWQTEAATPAATADPQPAAVRKPVRISHARTQPGAATATLDPSIHLGMLKEIDSSVYKGSGRNIFKSQPEPPKIPDPIVPPVLTPAVTTPLPPPINLKFYGFASQPGEPKKVFLSQGDDIFIAGEGDIINRRYKVRRITATTVEIEDMLNNRIQAIPLIQG